MSPALSLSLDRCCSYASRVRRVSELMRDQKEQPLDRVIYWIEYVIRHKGAPHLRSSSRHLNLFQRNCVDIISFIIIFAFIIVSIFVVFRVISSKKLAFDRVSLRKTKKNN